MRERCATSSAGCARRPRVHTLRSLAGTLGLSDDELAGLPAARPIRTVGRVPGRR
ncbi:hypothetical protein ACWEIM_07905 [Streptomyces sp. NPDC004778]